ncbi:hypothetical protein [Nocardia sp. XZ_19_385]|uniref:hypothetical protein n=1 Tax=Nocardia sp. XZ_19_385 TaxID=2769488 RepID=UPI0018909C13|nr:hypothetical protein [Nocardia sp. XZ_19_385]
MTTPPLRIWYVAAQRLCNFDCRYCVSTGDWAKSNRFDWRTAQDRDAFTAIVDWIGTRPYPVDVRLGSLGEPFASPIFLDRAAWLTRQPGVRFVELLSNASLIQRRLPSLESRANLGKLSLWLTWHQEQISLEKFIAAAAFAQDAYGCFVVVNTLLFADHDTTTIAQVKAACVEAGLRFNLDLGYDPTVPSATSGTDLGAAVPVLRSGRNVLDVVAACGGDTELTRTALIGLSSPQHRPCRAGADYVFIDIHGDVYRCSRYAALGLHRYGNVLDPDFALRLRENTWAPCEATSGCANKEDFLNLRVAEQLRPTVVPSLGWTEA